MTVQLMSIMTTNTTSEMNGITAANMNQICIPSDTHLVYTWDGSYWQPSNRILVKKNATPVNGMATGNTLIYTLESSSLNFYPTQIIMRAGTITGSIITAPVMTVGSNSTTYDNIAKSSLLSGLLATLGVGNAVPSMTSFSPPLAGGTAIYAKISTAATGPTVDTFSIEILGFYDV